MGYNEQIDKFRTNRKGTDNIIGLFNNFKGPVT